jgi:hypothetical protein
MEVKNQQLTTAEGLSSSIAHFRVLQESVFSVLESIEIEKSEVDRCRRSLSFEFPNYSVFSDNY